MTPDVWSSRIQEVGIIIAALAALATAWQGKIVRDLKEKVAHLEKTMELREAKFRTAIRHIREWMAWERQPEERGPVPVIPPDLIDDI